MKKLLIALALMPALQAEPTDVQSSVSQAEISPEMVKFAAKFNALHSYSIAEYAAIEQLFKDCGAIYSETFDLLFALNQREDEQLKKQSFELYDNFAPVVTDLNFLLHRVKELNNEMATFNAMLNQEATDYTEATNLLLGIAKEMHTIRVALETVKKYEANIQAQALQLSQID